MSQAKQVFYNNKVFQCSCKKANLAKCPKEARALQQG